MLDPLNDLTRLSLLRRDDMLVLGIRLVNLAMIEDASGSARLVVFDPASVASIEVIFPPQAMLEQAVAFGEDPPGTSHACDARFSGPSRLALLVTEEALPIPLAARGLLAWARLVGDPAGTALECVWGLSLRPGFLTNDTWAHAVEPATTGNGVTAMWQTSLVTRDASGSPDLSNRSMPLSCTLTQAFHPPFRSSLRDDQRQAIAAAIRLRPVLARELTLSAFGATIDLVGDWTDLPEAGLTEYRHRGAQGRDQSVATVQRGYLFPFGLPALLATYTERVEGSFGSAVLSQTSQLNLITPTVSYEGAVGLPFQGRGFPFRSLRVHDPLTATVTVTGGLAAGVSWIDARPGERFLFHFTAEDYEGHTVSFSAPVAFVDRAHAFKDLGRAVDGYNGERRSAPVTSAGRVALAIGAAPGRSAVDIMALYVGARTAIADADSLEQAGQLAAFPSLEGVDARIPSLEAFRGGRPRGAGPVNRVPGRPERAGIASSAGTPTQTPSRGGLKLDQNYLETGLAGPGIYARLAEQVPFLPPPSSAGGLAALALPVSGLSQEAGLVGGDLEAFRTGRFDPAKFFKPAGLPDFLPPKLLGFVPLPDLVQPATLGDGEAVPRIVTEVIFADGDHDRPPEAVRSTITWRPKVKAGLFGGVLSTSTATTLDLRCTTSADLRGGAPTSEVKGELRSFSLNFARSLLVVDFERLAFTSHAGATPSLDARVTKVRFGRDVLQFFDRLCSCFPSPANGPHVIVRDGSIEASYTLAIPTVPAGVFLLQNLALAASLTLPLDGRQVQTRFALSSREHPFLVTVSLFGGGGFFALEVVGDTIAELEVQLDFGAATALDLGVASAAVSVTAGIHITVIHDQPMLDGFFRAVGELDVLGVVSVSVEIYLVLLYVPEKMISGSAEFTVRVRVLFFSQSLPLHVERSFGAGGDPTFDVAFPTAQPWRERCAAFAPMVGP
jgi:hypothetical protein